MKKILVLLAFATSTFAAKPPGGGVTTPWFQTQWTSSSAWVTVNAPASSGNVGSFTFPTYTYRSSGRLVTSFLTTTTDTNLLGNITGKTITATLSVVAFFGTEFGYGGMLNSRGDGPGWNTGTMPANCRIFLTTYPGTYSNTYADAHANDFWWTHEGVAVIDDMTGTVTITATLDPAQWSNASGQFDATAFNAAITNVRQIGLAFGGGSFFDVGVGVLQDTGSASFYLNSFTVQ